MVNFEEATNSSLPSSQNPPKTSNLNLNSLTFNPNPEIISFSPPISAEMGVITTAKLVFFLLCLTTITSTSAAQNLKTFSIVFPSFNDSLAANNAEYLLFENSARNNNDALQITPDTANTAVFSLKNQSGRVMLKQPFKLYDGKVNNSVVASFNTSFLVNIYPVNSTAVVGEGLAFLIAPDFTIPANSHGEYLGLSNATTDGTPHGVVAVELDTVKQDFDPDDNHIGLDINSVRSNINVSLTKYGRLASPADGNPSFHNVWVNYDGVGKVIRVYIANQTEKFGPTPPMPTTPILEHSLDLSQYVAETSYFGFSASTGNLTQLNCVLRWNFTINYFPGPKSPLLNILLRVGIPVVVLLVAAVVLVVIYLYKKKLIGRSDSNILSRLRTLPGMPREFSYAELKKATNNFEEKRKLGQGGYGVVYKGILPGENSEVAVKMFSRERLKGEDDFLAELTIINRLRHKHLVRLLGWCHKNGKLLLVYEYMPKGSLDMHLFTDKKAELLGWNLRYKILSGVASALHYLHYEYDQKVVHRDMKSSNIMLDSNFNARLGDFGLARALDNEKTSYAEAEGCVLGTMGYIAPECFHTAKATQQSDVYAFGAVLIEVVCGLRPNAKINGFQFLVDWVWSLHREGCLLDAVDKRLGDDYVAEEAQRLLFLGLACSHPIASERPKTHAIVQMISGAVPVPTVPPFKPSFVWPAMGPVSDMTDATTIDTSPLSTTHYVSDCIPRSLVREDYSGYTDRSMV